MLGDIRIYIDGVDLAKVSVNHYVNQGQEKVNLVKRGICYSFSINYLLVKGSLTWDFH